MLQRLDAPDRFSTSWLGGTDSSPRRVSPGPAAPPAPWWSSPAAQAALIFVVAFLIRLLFLAEIAPHPLLDINTVRGTDMEGYIQWGRRIAAGNWLGRGEGPFSQGPAYPYFLAVIFSLFGGALFPVMVVQVVLGSLSAVLVYGIGRLAFGAAVGVVTGLMAAAYGLLVFFDVILHSTTLEVFLTCIALLLLAKASERGGRWWALSGAGAALAALARPNLLVVPPFVMAAILIRGRGQSARPLARAAGLFLAGFVLVILPVTIRNVTIGKQFVIVSSAGPETFRIANSYDSTPLNFRYPRLPQMPLDSWAFWRHQLVKGALFWWGFEAPQNVNYYLFRTASSVLQWPLLAYWGVVPLAGAGLLLARQRWGALLPLLFFGLGYYLSVVAFHIVGRFRLPLVPLLLVFAAYAVVIAWRVAVARQWVRLVVNAGGVALLMVLLRPWDFPLIYPVDHASYGYILANRGDLQAGLRELAMAEEGLPGYPNLNYDMGRMLVLLRQPREALARFEREMQISPRNPEVFRRAGLASRAMGDVPRATGYLERYLVLAPDGPRAQEVRTALEALRRGQARGR